MARSFENSRWVHPAEPSRFNDVGADNELVSVNSSISSARAEYHVREMRQCKSRDNDQWKRCVENDIIPVSPRARPALPARSRDAQSRRSWSFIEGATDRLKIDWNSFWTSRDPRDGRARCNYTCG